MSLPGSPFATLPPSVPTIAHLRVGDLQRGLAQQRDLLAEQVGADQLVLRRHRADDDVVAFLADPLEVGDAAEVDEIGGAREPQLHHRDEAVAAGEHAALLAEAGEQADRVIDGRRAMIGE